MSLAIVTTTNEGHILAADSMETYKNAIGDVREGSQSRLKVYRLNNMTGAAFCGLSFLDNRNIEQHLNNYLRENSFEGLKVEEIADKLYDLFLVKYTNYIKEFADKKERELRDNGFSDVESSWELECVTIKYKDLSKKPVTAEFYQPLLEFLIAGYDPDGKSAVYKITIPDAKSVNGITMKLDNGQCGATWIGQTDVLIRVIRGWSPEIKKIKTVAELPELKRHEFLSELDDQEYIINWATMTLQDAIDFSNMGIKITENIQRITDGTWQFPGSSPGVGGPVDIAVITPEQGFVWVQKKLLKIGGKTVSI